MAADADLLERHRPALRALLRDAGVGNGSVAVHASDGEPRELVITRHVRAEPRRPPPLKRPG